MPHPVLETLTVLDPDGREIRLNQLWAGGPAVLVFIRHFGCLFCRQQVGELGPLRERVRSLGGELFLVGHGTLEETRAFRDELATPFPLFTDPTRQAYRALQMRRGALTVLTPGVVVRSLRALRSGFRQTRVAGDPLQQGGVVVVGPGGREYYRFISREAGHHPPDSDVLAAVDAAVRSS